MTGTIEGVAERCANCGEDLQGEFCSHCGQRARDLHQPVGHLLSQAADDLLSLDARFLRTVPRLLLKPGEVTKQYLEGRRAGFVPPLRAYLLAALAFFGVFAFLAEEPRVIVVVRGSPEAAALNAAREKGEEGSGVSFELPERSRLGGATYDRALAHAKADPQAFGRAVFGNIPRTFFVLLPVFAVLLELFYRTQGYYVEHLVFSLYYHAFAFSWYTVILLVDAGNDWVPRLIRVPIGVAMGVWLAIYLPLALRRVYGGSWVRTVVKLSGLLVLYTVVMFFALLGAMFVALARF